MPGFLGSFDVAEMRERIKFLSSDSKFLATIHPLNPHTPVAQKSADEVVFRHFRGEGVEFF